MNGVVLYAFQIDMSHVKRDLFARNPQNASENPVITEGIDMDDYVPSQEWDVIAVPAKRHVEYYPCCVEPFPDIRFNLTLRRKHLFYTINIVIPCVCITLLTLTGFYVPCDCTEKISISLTILLSISMFQLLLLDLLPGTSLKVPLLGRYILFTLCVITASIISAVIVLYMKNRTDVSGQVPRLVRWLILDMLARLMCMPQPTQEEQDQEIEDQIDWSMANSDLANFSNPYKQKFRQRKSIIQQTMRDYASNGCSYTPGMDVSPRFLGVDNPMVSDFCEACEHTRMQKFPPNVQRAIEGVGFVAKRHRENEAVRKVSTCTLFKFFCLH
jgi:nicotinic acetylcholine receptor